MLKMNKRVGGVGSWELGVGSWEFGVGSSESSEFGEFGVALAGGYANAGRTLAFYIFSSTPNSQLPTPPTLLFILSILDQTNLLKIKLIVVKAHMID